MVHEGDEVHVVVDAAVTSSPAVVGDTVYVSALKGRVVAVSAQTGTIRWSTVLATHRLTPLSAQLHAPTFVMSRFTFVANRAAETRLPV